LLNKLIHNYDLYKILFCLKFEFERAVFKILQILRNLTNYRLDRLSTLRDVSEDNDSRQRNK